VSDDHLGGGVDFGHRRRGREAEREDDVFIELVGDASADVIGSDGRVECSGCVVR
jgi:hypothetical protein